IWAIIPCQWQPLPMTRQLSIRSVSCVVSHRRERSGEMREKELTESGFGHVSPI
ncbi:hypothetical protein TorRG33x02_156000, partial [Trema orientale]